MQFRIRRDDQVMVISGSNKGKTGKVIKVFREKRTVLVDKLNVVKRHQKPSQKYKQGGIIEKEAPIALSNVMLLCEKCKGPVRTGAKILDGGRKLRYCKSCKEVLDK
ncbi:MAG: 50S ribosomal protein L24 [Deltaproteobacteria bacterium]|nr:50S ribosomal protein L24 [Deltaproteobacteria bacterium]